VGNCRFWEVLVMKKLIVVLGTLLSLSLTSPALAHHALGGSAPVSFVEGLLSGLAHPVINIDHLAFVVAVGVLTAVGQASKFLPVWFVGGSILGTVLAVQGIVIPYAGWLALLMLIGIGTGLAFGYKSLRFTDVIAFAVAGILHGSVYAEAVVGTVSSSLSGYLLGFAAIQAVIASASMMVAYMMWAGDRLYANARVLGGVVAGVGLTVMAQSAASTFFSQI
jgi:urease accessory protein